MNVNNKCERLKIVFYFNFYCKKSNKNKIIKLLAKSKWLNLPIFFFLNKNYIKMR